MPKISFSEFLNEAPLPDDWDSHMFSPRTPFAKMVRYAQERAQKVGQGSSRVAFKIPYQGRDTVLKVAKNRKGMAQNEVEARTLEDWYLQKLNLMIPLIDYDEQHDQPTWIHMEYATKAKESDFKRATGGTLSQTIETAIVLSGNSSLRGFKYYREHPSVNQESELIQSLVDYFGNYGDVQVGDLFRLANWGIYNGHPVIVDAGLDADTYKTFYSK